MQLRSTWFDGAGRDRPGRDTIDGTVSAVAFVPGERRTEYDQYMDILDGLEHVPVACRSLAEAFAMPGRE